MRSLREMTRSFRAHPGFAVAVLITLALAGLIGLMVFLMQLQPGFMGMAHGTEPAHRIHFPHMSAGWQTTWADGCGCSKVYRPRSIASSWQIGYDPRGTETRPYAALP